MRKSKPIGVARVDLGSGFSGMSGRDVFMRRPAGAAVWLSWVLCFTVLTPAVATPVIWSFSGEVTRVTDRDGLLGGSVTLGMPFGGMFTFESTTPDSDPDDPTQGIYEDAVSILTGEVGGNVFLNIGSMDIQVLNDVGVQSPSDNFNILGRALLVERNINFFVVLIDSDASVFSDDSLPLSPPAIQPFEQNSYGLSSQAVGIGIVGELSSFQVIPEPGTLLLLGIGATVVLGRYRRRRRFAGCHRQAQACPCTVTKAGLRPTTRPDTRHCTADG